MKSYTVHLIRNALTDESCDGRYIGHTDVEISESGKAQLRQMKDELVFPPVEAKAVFFNGKCLHLLFLLFCNSD